MMYEEKKHTSKGKGELEERNSGSSARAEAMGHDINIRMTATEFGVNDDKTYCPVCDATQCHEQKQTRKETSLS